MTILALQNWHILSGVILMASLPVIVVMLSELSYRWEGTSFEVYRSPLDLFRNTTLILAFVSALLHFIVQMPTTQIPLRLVDTGLWISVINCALALFNSFVLSGKSDKANGVPKLILDLIRCSIVLLCAALVISNIWEVSVTAFIAAFGIGSLVIGLALQDTLGNLFSGIVLVSGRSFKVGDWIQMGDIVGKVTNITWRNVVVSNLSNTITIPNGTIAKKPFLTYGAFDGRFYALTEVTFSNKIPPEKIFALMRETTKAVKNCLASPPPLISLMGYDGNDVRYRAKMYVEDHDSRLTVRSEFYANIWYRARRENIPFGAAPHRLARYPVASDRPEPPVIAARVAANPVFGSWRSDPMSIPLTLIHKLYRSGEIILPTSERSGHLLILSGGSAAAFRLPNAATRGGRGAGLDDDQKAEPDIESATLVEVFQPTEMIAYKAFFKNGPSPVTLIAETDVEAVAIPITEVQALVVNDPQVAEELEKILQMREQAIRRVDSEGLDDFEEDTSRVDVLRTLFGE